MYGKDQRQIYYTNKLDKERKKLNEYQSRADKAISVILKKAEDIQKIER